MAQKHHYTGLTDAEVLASRKKHGVNILTPPEEESTWDKIKDCMHYWLIKLILGLFVASIAAIIILNATGVEMPTNVWIGPVILVVLFFLTYMVAYLGGDWDDEERKFDMDPLRNSYSCAVAWIIRHSWRQHNRSAHLLYLSCASDDLPEERC